MLGTMAHHSSMLQHIDTKWTRDACVVAGGGGEGTAHEGNEGSGERGPKKFELHGGDVAPR